MSCDVLYSLQYKHTYIRPSVLSSQVLNCSLNLSMFSPVAYKRKLKPPLSIQGQKNPNF